MSAIHRNGEDPSEEGALVAVVRAGYRTAEARLERILSLLDYRPRSPLLLKPNLATTPLWLPLGRIPRCVATDLRFLEAFLRVLAGHEIVIADGSLAGGDTDRTLERTGVAALARRYGARVVNLDRAERVAVPWAYGTLRLPALLQTHEYINLPKLKSHVLTGMSLGCKNQKGLLSGADKIRFHRELELDAAIRALTAAVRPALTIVDGIEGMDGPGPTAGRTRRPGLIVAGRDVRAVDVACCDLVGVPLERVGHLSRVPYTTVGDEVRPLRRSYATPACTRMANLHIHAGPATCSRCMQSMHAGAAALWRSPRHVLLGTWSCILHRTDLILGPVAEIPAAARGRLVCYGDCTRALAKAHNLPWIPGCPPTVDDHLALY